MKDQQGHNYFFAIPKLWKEKEMAIISEELAARLDDFEERIKALESALSALQEKQEEVEDSEE